MAPRLIDGRVLAKKIKDEIKAKVSHLEKKHKRPPQLAVLLIGDDPASHIYVRHKEKACEEVGIISQTYRLPGNISQDELLLIIDRLNKDAHVDGILPQFPLPAHIDRQTLIFAIDPHKDVDGLHYVNQGRLSWGVASLFPCTPLGIIELLRHEAIPFAGQHAVVIGKSLLVGAPAAVMLQHLGATVSIVHSQTSNPKGLTQMADLLIVAAGSKGLVTADWIKEGVTIVDVGIHRNPDGKIVGDVDFDSVKDKVKSITPVPGGVGPMTIVMLLRNTLQAYELGKS